MFVMDEPRQVAVAVVGVRCPQCPAVTADESSLAAHLLSEHNMRLVVTATDSTAAAATTGCPVCRRQVDDLPRHFAVDHPTAPRPLQHRPPPRSKLRGEGPAARVKVEAGNEENGAINLSVKDNVGERNNNNGDGRKGRRRKQTSVPEQEKDQRYWTRRLKNNEAAKRSRDMRIQREKIIFDENARLEERSSELMRDRERLITDNKELRLKMELVMEENARLKAIIESLQQQG